MDSLIKNDIKADAYDKSSPFWIVKRNTDNFNLFFDKFYILPENIKELVSSVETASSIWQIGQKNKFSEEQISKIAVLAWKILSAEIPIAQFIPDISQELNLPIETARAIAQEINIKIFSKAAAQIRKLHESKFSNGQQKQSVPAILDERSKNQEARVKEDANRLRVARSELQVRRPEERVVNLQKRIEEKPKYIEPGPKIEGNVVDLSR